MKHYFFLILNTYTYETHYRHGAYKGIDEIKESLIPDESLIKVLEVSREVPVK